MRRRIQFGFGTAMIVYSLNGQRVAEIVTRGAPLDSDRYVSDLVDEARCSNAQWVVIPAERLSNDFFRLAAKAGDFIDRFVRHRIRLAILGAPERPEDVPESVLFLRDNNELYATLAPAK